MIAVVRLVLTGLGIFLLQWLVLGRLQLWGAYPDAPLLFVILLGLYRGRVHGALSGFLIGFLMDFVYGTWGIHMFVKTLVGFLLGLFSPRERESLLIRPQQALIGALVIALVHNGLVATLLALQAGTRNLFLALALWIGSSLYTALLGLLASTFLDR